MANIYLENNVYEETLDRIREVYDHFDDVIVSMSGGKDSTSLLECTLIVAREKGRLPVKVFWLDQEVEWKSTSDYMLEVAKREEIEPYYFQIPFKFTNSLSHKSNFIDVWNEDEKDKWVRPRFDFAITENPTPFDRFQKLVNELPKHIADKDKQTGVLVGMRISESLNRRMTISHGKGWFRGILGLTSLTNTYKYYSLFMIGRTTMFGRLLVSLIGSITRYTTRCINLAFQKLK